MKRIITCILIVTFLIGALAVPSYAAEFDNDFELQVLDYATANGGTSNRISFTGSGTASYQLPDVFNLSYVDILFNINNGTPTLSISGGTSSTSNNLTVVQVGRYLYRAYGYIPTNFFNTLHLHFTSTHSGSCTVVIKSFKVYTKDFITPDISVEASGFYTEGDIDLSLNYGDDRPSYIFFQPSGEFYDTQFVVDLFCEDWRLYDFVDIQVSLSVTSINSVGASFNGQAVPFTVNEIISDGAFIQLYYLVLRLDLRDLDRNADGTPHITISGSANYDHLNAFSLHDATGFCAIEFNSISYFFNKLFNQLSSSFNGLSELIESWSDTINKSISSLKTSITNKLTSVGTDIVTSITDFESTVDSWSDTINKSISSLKTSITNKLASVGTDIVTSITDFESTVDSWFDTVNNSISSLETSLNDSLSSVGTDIVDSITDFESTVDSWSDTINKSIGSLKTSITNKLTSVGTDIVDAITDLEVTVSDFDDAINDTVASWSDTINKSIDTWSDTINSTITSFNDDVSLRFDDLFGQLEGFRLQVETSLFSVFSSINDWGFNIETALHEIRDVIIGEKTDNSVVSGAIDYQENVNNEINSELSEAIGSWDDNLGSVSDGFNLALVNATPALIWLSGIAQNVFSSMGWFGNIFFFLGFLHVFFLLMSKSGLGRAIDRADKRGDD